MYGANNSQAFGYEPIIGYTGLSVVNLYDAVLRRFRELELGEASDPIFPFIKQEPHKVSKAKDGRWRLICGVGATDQLVAEILLRPILTATMNGCLKNGFAIGWSPVASCGIPSIWDVIKKRTECRDKSNFDWTCCPWTKQLISHWFSQSNPNNSTVITNHASSMMGKKKFDSGSFQDSHDHDGVMPSGWKATILVNSAIQLASHDIVLEREDNDEDLYDVLAMGDDTAQEPEDDPEAYNEAQEKLGFKIKQTTYGHEFCGFEFTEECYHPCYVGKHGFKLQHLKESEAEDVLSSYQYIYCFEPDQLSYIHDMLEINGYSHRIIDAKTLQGVPLGILNVPVAQPLDSTILNFDG